MMVAWLFSNIIIFEQTFQQIPALLLFETNFFLAHDVTVFYVLGSERKAKLSKFIFYSSLLHESIYLNYKFDVFKYPYYSLPTLLMIKFW